MTTLMRTVILWVGFLVLVVQARPNERVYPLRLQPELDVINLDKYLKNERLLDLQIKCVLYDGPCDVVGRWVKPRVSAAFVGECPFCTEHQKANVQKVVQYIQEKRPEVYKYALIKFLKASGVEVHKNATEFVAMPLVTEAIPIEATEVTTILPVSEH